MSKVMFRVTSIRKIRQTSSEMYKIKAGLFCVRNCLTRNSLQGSSFLAFKLFNGRDRRDHDTKFSNISLNPSARFYTKDSKEGKRESDKLFDKLKKDKDPESPVNLTSEQIKALFYTKFTEPIALISQDKYYAYLQEKHKKSTKNEESKPKGANASNRKNNTKIPEQMSTANSFESNKNDGSVKKSVAGEVGSANVINSLIEKELGGESGDFGGGASKESTESNKNSWRAIKYVFFVIGTSIIGVVVGIVMFVGAPKVDEDDQLVTDEYYEMPVVLQYIFRTIDEFHNFNKLIKDPSRDKLLPDVLKPPYYQPPYTLVLEFTDLLVHPEWTYSTGWRFKKRPGLDQFLETLYTRYEVVVYTAEMGMTVFPIIETLDKNNLISYKLVRDATKFMDGHHVKDLDKLNRDLSKVIVIDWNPESNKLQTDNLFRIPRWNGNDDDTTLYDLTSFLIAISEWKVEDVRTVLNYYREFDDPLGSFKERQKLLASQNYSL